MFFSILSQWLLEYLLKNQYIDPFVQKGGIPEVPGCLEHSGVVAQLLKEAHEGKGDLAVLWLRMAPYPTSTKTLIMDKYNNFNLRTRMQRPQN